jgi:hypothetical protein
MSSLVPKAIGPGIANLVLAVKDFLKDRNAYVSLVPSTPSIPVTGAKYIPQKDLDVPNKCILDMRTTNGGQCETSIQCSGDGAIAEKLPDWNVCYLHGRQYFTHPKIGDFSIEYTQAGGVDGNKEDGLHHPVIQMANLNNWEPLNVDNIIDSSSGGHGNLCKKSNDGIHPSIHYQCGIPEIGRVAYGLSNLSPADPAPGFTPGWCTMHIAQHQRNEYGIGPDYAFDVVLFDNAKKVIGSVQRAGIDGNSKTLSFTSYLPYTVEITAKGGDNDPVVFKYGDQTWDSNDEGHQSTLGKGPRHGYEAGNREGDMGFSC